MKSCVIDTSVVVAGLMSPWGPAGTLVRAMYGDMLRWAVDGRILREYGEVSARPKFKLAPNEPYFLMLKLRSSALWILPIPCSLKLPDKSDRPFIEVALALPQPIIVTRNLRHFVPAAKLGVEILTPEQAIPGLLAP